jgi:hypothetical protein
MIEAVISGMIVLCLIALAFYLIEWVLSAIGLGLPAPVVTILKVILILVAIAVLWNMFSPMIGGYGFRRL